MNLTLRLLTAITLTVAASIPTLSAQEESHHGHHHHPRNEIGISPGATWAPTHEVWSVGIHAHYFRLLTPHSKWAWGAGVEYVGGEGTHTTLMAGIKWMPIHRLTLAVMPGVTLFKHHDHEDGPHRSGETHANEKFRARISGHFELAYELIHYKNFHFGPAVDYALMRGDSHFMAGFHFAYGF